MKIMKIRLMLASSGLFVMLAGTNFGLANESSSTEMTMENLVAWLDAYGEAWESRDADKAATLFSSDSTYQVTPYEEPHRGPDGVRQYWAGVTENQRNVQFEHEPLSINGNTGIAHWSAQFDIDPDGPHLELNGIFVLKFDQDGKCSQLREWWHLKGPEAGAE
jgi:ketosteroid isomerase-like protein